LLIEKNWHPLCNAYHCCAPPPTHGLVWLIHFLVFCIRMGCCVSNGALDAGTYCRFQLTHPMCRALGYFGFLNVPKSLTLFHHREKFTDDLASKLRTRNVVVRTTSTTSRIENIYHHESEDVQWAMSCARYVVYFWDVDGTSAMLLLGLGRGPAPTQLCHRSCLVKLPAAHETVRARLSDLRITYCSSEAKVLFTDCEFSIGESVECWADDTKGFSHIHPKPTHETS
jgi:hypothetical protein